VFAPAAISAVQASAPAPSVSSSANVTAVAATVGATAQVLSVAAGGVSEVTPPPAQVSVAAQAPLGVVAVGYVPGLVVRDVNFDYVPLIGDPQGSQDYWEDLRFPASGINPAGIATPPAVDGNDGCFLFHASGTDTIGIIAQMPHAWREGSAIFPHIHWAATDAAAGNVLWRLEWQIADIGETFPGVWSTNDLLVATSGVAEKHVVNAFSNIAMAGRKISCILKIRVNRIGSDGSDTYSTSAKLYEFDIHYRIDSQGSIKEYVK
jgi:hypothetical protein